MNGIFFIIRNTQTQQQNSENEEIFLKDWVQDPGFIHKTHFNYGNG
jgi:hypothetical protein